jgi:phosphatidylglycerol---prolipoprotein diacylglyceryl transferase
MFAANGDGASVIPYHQFPVLRLGPFTIEALGVFAAVGVCFGVWLVISRAGKMGLDRAPLLDLGFWIVPCGLVMSHLVHLVAYHPEELRDLQKVLRVWDGLSSIGAMLGGTLTTVAFFRLRHVKLTPYFDAFALGLAPGWSVARIGCFLVHDHPGVRTDFPLAVAFPGGARHDLGFYDGLLLAAIAAVIWTLYRRGAMKGMLLPVLVVLYGLGRFGCDFLRASDVPYHDARYLGLTPAQYFSVALFAWGAVMLARWARKRAPQVQSPIP